MKGHVRERSTGYRVLITIALALLCGAICGTVLVLHSRNIAPSSEQAVIAPGHEKELMAALMPPQGNDWLNKEVNIRIEDNRIRLLFNTNAADSLSFLILARSYFVRPQENCEALDELWICPETDHPSDDRLIVAYKKWLKEDGRSARVAAVWNADASSTAHIFAPHPTEQLAWLLLLVLAWAVGERQRKRGRLETGTDWPSIVFFWLLCLAVSYGVLTAANGHESQWWFKWLIVGVVSGLTAYRLPLEPTGTGKPSKSLITLALSILTVSLLWSMLWWEPVAGYEVNRLEISRSGLAEIYLNERRNPFLYYLFLKISVAILPLPVALHAVSALACLIGITVFAHALMRFGFRPLAAALAAFLLILSPAYAHYGADTHPMSLGLMWIVLTAWMLIEKQKDGASFFSLLAIYTIHPAWLFFPAFLLSFQRRFRQKPNWWWWISLAPAAWIVVRNTLLTYKESIPAFSPHYGLPWIEGTSLDVAALGLSYMSPGGVILGGLALWSLALYRGIWSPSSLEKLEALAYAIPPVLLFLTIPIMRVRGEHFAVLIIPLILYGLTSLYRLSRRGLRLWLIIVLALALGNGALFYFSGEPNESSRDGLSQSIPENADVWTSDFSQARLLAYERNPETLGNAWNSGSVSMPTYRNGTGTISSLIDWFDGSHASDDEAALVLIRQFQRASAEFYMLMDDRYRFPNALRNWINRNCSKKASEHEKTVYYCAKSRRSGGFHPAQ
jgi:hypothetical protein